jgi:hypothetical protein
MGLMAVWNLGNEEEVGNVEVISGASPLRTGGVGASPVRVCEAETGQWHQEVDSVISGFFRGFSVSRFSGVAGRWRGRGRGYGAKGEARDLRACGNSQMDGDGGSTGLIQAPRSNSTGPRSPPLHGLKSVQSTGSTTEVSRTIALMDAGASLGCDHAEHGHEEARGGEEPRRGLCSS